MLSPGPEAERLEVTRALNPSNSHTCSHLRNVYNNKFCFVFLLVVLFKSVENLSMCSILRRFSLDY